MKNEKHSMLNLEKEMKIIDLDNVVNNPVADEQSYVNEIYSHFKNEINVNENNKPYPDVSPYSVGYCYDDIDNLRIKKNSNRRFEEKIEQLRAYYDQPELYYGHMKYQMNHVFIMKNNLDSKIINIDGKIIQLINYNDRTYDEHIKRWRFGDDQTITYSRNITMEDRIVKQVDIIIDRTNYKFDKINDAYLINVLKRNKDAKIINIIQTIQKKQNDIRTQNKTKSLIVQGCAGSGKTMVLLHRISYLLYNKDIKNTEYMLLVPDKILIDYISDISNNFNISNRNIISYQDFYKQIISSKSPSIDKYNSIPKNNENELVFSLDYLNEVYSEYFIQEAYENFLSSISLQIKEFTNVLKIKKINDPNNIISYKEIKELNTYVFDSLILDLLPSFLEIQKIIDKGKKILSSFYRHFTKDEMMNLAKQSPIFFLNEKKIYDSLYKNLFSECEKLIHNKFKTKLRDIYKHYWYLQLYCAYLTQPIRCENVKYLFIDEAQDLSFSEINLLKKIIENERTPVFNLFGDINQLITKHGIKNWEVLQDIGLSLNYTLNENFRNTNQIIDYCNKMLSISMEKVGIDMEQVSEYSNIDQVIQSNKLLHHPIFIVKDEKSECDLKEILEKETNITDYEIYTVKSVKGLEFKETFVFDKNMEKNEKYIAYTRALVKLNVIKESLDSPNRSKISVT